ncbi:hypothetical protein IWW38_005971, partial [Coemansia aciculifera]
MAAIEWHIRVKALMESGAEREFEINALSDETVGDFRGRLATTSQVEPQKQRLIFRGRLLVDDAQKLADAGVSNGSALHMVARATETSNSRPRDERSGLQSNDSPYVHIRSLPPNFTPLAAHVMEQTFHRLRSRGRDSGGTPAEPGQFPPRAANDTPQTLHNYMQRLIHSVHRDFGADNGGDWIA